MLNTLIRSIIVYIGVILAVRLMGKRQIGELQPSELVVTFLLSEIASIPIEDSEYPLLQCFTSVALLVCLEILFSVISLKSRVFRTALQGNSVLIINDGKIVYDNIKSIRYSIEDLMEALRLKDVFDINDVQYAYIETNGSISIQLKPEHRTVTMDDLTNLNKKESSLPCLVISDGKIVNNEFELCHMTYEKLKKFLKQKNVDINDVFLMTADKNKNYYLIKRNGDILSND